MKNNIEQIPNLIFDWIEIYSFQDLNETQQQQVLQHFSMDEYNDMHATANALTNIAMQASNKNNKQELLNLFDQQFTNHNKHKFNLWHAASILLFICSSIFMYNSFNKSNSSAQLVNNIHDTIFIEKNMTQANNIINDTIEIIKNVMTTKNIVKHHTKQLIAKHNYFNIKTEISNLNNIPKSRMTPQVDLQFLNAKCNNSKNNSRAKSVLEKQFELVSL
jgi:hypothetical protein